MLEQNNVVLTGEIVKLDKPFKSYGKTFYSATILVARTKTNDDYIRIVYPKSFTCGELRKGDSVYVKGSIKTYHNNTYVQCERVDREEGLVPINEISLHGFIHTDPSLRMTKANKKICKFMVKTINPFGNRYYIPIIAWDSNATYLSTYPTETEIHLKGRLQSKDYFTTDADGFTEVNGTVLEVSITSFRVVESEEL